MGGAIEVAGQSPERRAAAARHPAPDPPRVAKSTAVDLILWRPTSKSTVVYLNEDSWLAGQGHVADLVEEQRPAVALVELADMAAVGTGEGPLLVAEQLALQERSGIFPDSSCLAVRQAEPLVMAKSRVITLFPPPCRIIPPLVFLRAAGGQ